MWDGAVGLLTPAVASSGSSAQIMGMDGIDESIAAIAEDSGQDVTIAVSPPAWQGWAAFDDIERSLQGLPLVDYVSNTRLIDSTNIGDGGLAAVMPEHVGFEKAFVAAWNGQ
jgi:threonine dehydrogenase-like Zn-dependent dehydrogenase